MLLAALARTQKLTRAELLGLKPIVDDTLPRTMRLRKWLRKVEEFAPADQRAVFKFVDKLVATRRRAGRAGM